MAFKRLGRKERSGDSGDPNNVDGSPVDASEMFIYVLLTDSRRKHKCLKEFVYDLCERIMRPALADWTHCFDGKRSGRTIELLLTLEGSGVDFRISAVKVEGWELTEMSSRINEAFNKYWGQEIDRIPPR
jgi:hypothetical protein